MYANVNGVRLFFDVLNPQLEIVSGGLKEKPTLVCLPGGPGGDHQTLRPFFDRFANVAQVVYLDHRASGRSASGDPSQWTLDQWGDDIAAFCDAIGTMKPIILGVSGGAIIAQAYLARHPGQAGAAILVNPCSRMVRAELISGFARLGGPEAEAAATAMYTRGAPEDAPAFFRHCMPHYSRTGSFGPPDAASRVRINFQVSQHFFGPGGEAFRYDHRQALGNVVSPVLMLIGAHDPVTRPEWGMEVAAALPSDRGEAVMFDGSSHMIVADEPEKLTAVIEAFIARIG